MLPLLILTFLPLLIVVVLAIIPAPDFHLRPAPRYWTLIGGTLGFLAGAAYFGITQVPEPVIDPDTGQTLATTQTRIELLMAGLGGLFGCFAGIVTFRSGRKILLRALHNLQRLTRTRTP